MFIALGKDGIIGIDALNHINSGQIKVFSNKDNYYLYYPILLKIFIF